MDAWSEPWGPFERWMAEAEPTEPRVPEAMQIATCGADGLPSVRTVLLKGFGPQTGLRFYTNLGSDKARQLRENPGIGFLLHFKGLERQIRGEGHATLLPDADADSYWASRPRGSQLGAWASRQSAPIEDRQALVQATADATARFRNGPVPRPPFWSGYRIDPVRIEFWQGQPDRLHDRVVFSRTPQGWKRTRLQP